MRLPRNAAYAFAGIVLGIVPAMAGPDDKSAVDSILGDDSDEGDHVVGEELCRSSSKPSMGTGLGGFSASNP
jgi:hypothetical protein